MFTGIISHMGKLEVVKGYRYTFSSTRSFFKKLGKGGSVSVNGICLTVVVAPDKNTFSVEVMPETLKRTMLDELQPGDYVNLELPVSPADLFAGHIVQGHIDGTGVIASIAKEQVFISKFEKFRNEESDNSWIFTFKVGESLSKYIIEKGSIAVNGISLTVIESSKGFFTVGIIPYTWENTMLKFSKIGDKVNIEVDVIAKYVEKFVSLRK